MVHVNPSSSAPIQPHTIFFHIQRLTTLSFFTESLLLCPGAFSRIFFPLFPFFSPIRITLSVLFIGCNVIEAFVCSVFIFPFSLLLIFNGKKWEKTAMRSETTGDKGCRRMQMKSRDKGDHLS